ncbi:hypothetical protein F66182_486 [Fusarium sp. NRRL 66182]|nr:hypothetical protein F66182_486 [Fusarium sp. NRRL 66182]
MSAAVPNVQCGFEGNPDMFSSATYAVLAIELTLHWNKVAGVYALGGAGQMIPFTISVCILTKTIYTLLPESLEEKIESTKPDDNERPDESNEMDQAAPPNRSATV